MRHRISHSSATGETLITGSVRAISYPEKRSRELLEAMALHDATHRTLAGYPFCVLGAPALCIKHGRMHAYASAITILRGASVPGALALRVRRLQVEMDGLREIASILSNTRVQKGESK